MNKLFAIFTGVLWLCLSGGAAEQPAQRIVLFGDSITHGGWQTEWMQYFLATRYPQRPVHLLNCGVAGGTAESGLRRLDWDLWPQKPDMVYMMFGMNDINRDLYAEEPPSAANAAERRRALQRYEKSLEALLRQMEERRVAVMVVTPSPYDQYGAADTPRLAAANEALAQCAMVVRRVVENHRAGVVELHRPMTQWLQEHPEAQLAGADRIHPGPVGDWYMALAMLDGYAGKVTELEISAVGAVLLQEHCRIAEAEFSPERIRFLYLPKALPLAPTSELTALAELQPEFRGRFNTERFSVSLLPPREYEILGNGELLGRFSEVQLAEGIDLARLDTPSVRQSFEVDALVRELHELHSRLRSVAYACHIMSENGVIDPWAVGAGEAFFPDFIAGQSDFMKTHIGGVYEAWRADAGNVAALEAGRDLLWDAIFTAARPRGWFLEVRPAENKK